MIPSITSYRKKLCFSSLIKLEWTIVLLIGFYNMHHQTTCQSFVLQPEPLSNIRYHHPHLLRSLSFTKPISCPENEFQCGNRRQHHLKSLVLKNEINPDSSGSSGEINHLNDDNLRRSSAMISSNNTLRTSMPTKNKLPTIWSSRHDLFQMIRPNNIPGIILFHMLGVYLVLVHVATVATTVASSSTILTDTIIVIPKYWNLLLKEPVLWLTLLSTNLVSATSMVVNDYYDAKLGRDSLKQNNHHQEQDDDDYSNNNNISSSSISYNDIKWILHPVNGIWNKLVTRRLLMYLYSIALCLSSCLPGIPTRISVNVALMMTYMYTVHFKPITLMKNVVCAMLIALAPWTSGSCTLYLLQQQYNLPIVGAGSGSLGSILHGGVWVIPSLWRLFGVLFTGVLGREILMDCNDVVADRASGIRTIPVVYGNQFASYVATFTTIIMTYLAIASPLQHFLPLISPSASWSLESNLNVMVQIWRTTPFRRLVFAGLGCIVQLNGIRKILQTKASNKLVIDKMIEQNLFTVILLMASFV